MSTFKNSDELNQVMLNLWTEISQTPHIANPLLESKLIVTFHYRSPDGKLTIDCANGSDFNILLGDNEIKPLIELFMKAEVANEFWLGKINVPMALLSGKIVSKGPINKALALLPAIKPAFQIYPNIIAKLNQSDS